MAAVVLPRTCRQCGAVFAGGPRAWYCPKCREGRRRDADRRFREKGRRADRPIGSIDACKRCGKEYVVNSARQKYCPECAYEAVREVDRPASKEWNQDHKETYYPAKNEKRRAQRKEDPEAVQKKDREYWAKNREKQREKNKRYRDKKKKEREKEKEKKSAPEE